MISTEVAPSRRRRVAISVAGPVVVAAVLALVLVGHGRGIARAADRADAGTLALAVALSLVTLTARSEAVVACLRAMGSGARRRDIHAANSLTFLAGTLNHYVSSIVRAALLKRLDPEQSPTILQMVTVDAATSVIEGVLVVVVIVISAGTLHVAWWLVLLIVAAAAGGVGLVLAARRRLSRLQALRGLDVLAHSRHRVEVAGLMAVVIACNVLRTFLVLRATGLHPSLLQASATFVAAGVLSSLLAGPGAGTAGAPLIVFGHRSVGAAGAAGLILSATALLAAALYAVLGAPSYLRRLRARI